MTTYHRGRARSVYRKRSQLIVQTYGSQYQRQVSTFAPPPSSGSTLIKSIRGLGLAAVLGAENDKYAGGWIGFARYARPLTAATIDLAESEIFGVKNWSCGPHTDFHFDLDLKGITLTKDETFYMVGECNGINSSTTVLVMVEFMYAEHEMPA